ncbi:MAG TPA: COG1615 family transporter, partial [Firmicutes bacterium]|nr:COG1615 family transporter [Bacillota bacterium]
NYGKVHLYHFPKDTVVQGPRQIDARIDQDTDISANLTLWSRTDGSNVVRGNLLVIPVGDTVLYVEPVYILAAGNDLPELKRVIVATHDSIAMRPTLREALAAIVGSDPGPLTPGDDPSAGGDATLQSIGDQLERALQAAKQAQQSGNWAEYGRQQEILEKLIQELQQLLQSP